MMSATQPAAGAARILARVKNLDAHLQEGEQPLFTMPAIWDGGQSQHSTPCEIVLTNQRLLGYSYVTFPRERLFLDALTLTEISAVSLRQRSHEPLFRELLVSEGQRKVYIRASRKKVEELYAVLRKTGEEQNAAFQTGPEPVKTEVTEAHQPPVYGRQELRVPFERSLLQVTLLFVGGLALEILGAVIWGATGSPQAGVPLFFAGLLAVGTAFLVRRQRRS